MAKAQSFLMVIILMPVKPFLTWPKASQELFMAPIPSLILRLALIVLAWLKVSLGLST